MSLPSVVASSSASSMPSLLCISLANQARVPRPRTWRRPPSPPGV
jgi:hypothetical protein